MRDEERIKEAFMDLLNQACGEWDPGAYEGGKMVKQRQFIGYDSQCLSSYEAALDLAVELGWIKSEHVIR